MDYKIVEKGEFKVIGEARQFDMETSGKEIPEFWTEYYRSGKGEIVCGMYGVCIDTNMGSKKFEYLIADDYDGKREIPTGFKTVTIPKNTWAVFPCIGAMPNSLQSVNQKIFSEWLPNCKEYEIAGGYNIEYYTDVNDYKNGTQDENYYSEIWITIKKK